MAGKIKVDNASIDKGMSESGQKADIAMTAGVGGAGTGGESGVGGDEGISGAGAAHLSTDAQSAMKIGGQQGSVQQTQPTTSQTHGVTRESVETSTGATVFGATDGGFATHRGADWSSAAAQAVDLDAASMGGGGLVADLHSSPTGAEHFAPPGPLTMPGPADLDADWSRAAAQAADIDGDILGDGGFAPELDSGGDATADALGLGGSGGLQGRIGSIGQDMATSGGSGPSPGLHGPSAQMHSGADTLGDGGFATEVAPGEAAIVEHHDTAIDYGDLMDLPAIDPLDFDG
jgi:hypothetical protein